MDGCWVLMVFSGVSRLFSFLDLRWCKGLSMMVGVMRKGGLCDM